ncbi:MAG: hydroxyacylglutathione hydrolase [Neisseria sp.]|nr:hydroxyacylglutathione hydrolase [Neisseria sp.]
MKIIPLPALRDNYIWLLDNGENVICVDPGEAAPVQAYLTQHRRDLSAIWLTHRHADHIGGVAALRQAFPQCKVYGSAAIAEVTDPVGEGDCISYDGGTATVWAVPGHTREHVVFLLHDDAGRQHVFCGDTLFSGGCGRVFDGTMDALQSALERMNRLPENTLFYPAHEYTAANLCFAAEIEPDNPDIAAAFQAASITPTLPVSLAHERKINPFLRYALPPVRQRIAQVRKIDADNDAVVFSALRQWKNEW